MGDHGPVQRDPAQGYVGEVQQRPVVEAQGDIQIAQANVHINAEDMPSDP